MKRSRDCSILLVAPLFAAVAGCQLVVPPVTEETVETLEVNEGAFVGFIPLERAIQDTERTFTQEEAERLFKPIDEFVQAEFGGTVMNVQFRYSTGETTNILRGSREPDVSLYQLGDELSDDEEVDPDSFMQGPRLDISDEVAEPLFLGIEDALQREFGNDTMIFESQIEFRTASGRIVIMAGSWRRTPTGYWLHSVIVIVIRF